MSLFLSVSLSKEFSSIEEMENFREALIQFVGDVEIFETDFCESIKKIKK